MADPFQNFPEHAHPAKNFTPRANPPKTQAKTVISEPIDAATLAKLESMDAPALRALIRKVSGSQLAIALMTKEEVAEAMMHRLAVKALDPAGREALSAINAWLDRERGKPVTPVAAMIKDVSDKPVDRKQLVRELEFLMALSGNDEATMIENAK